MISMSKTQETNYTMINSFIFTLSLIIIFITILFPLTLPFGIYELEQPKEKRKHRSKPSATYLSLLQATACNSRKKGER